MCEQYASGRSAFTIEGQVCSKIMVVGAAEAGKSTFVAALCHRPMNLAVNGRTVAMDHGLLKRAEAKVFLIGVPGQRRFSWVRESLMIGARAVVWIHRTGMQVDHDTMILVQDLRVPYLVVANDSDSRHQQSWSRPHQLPMPHGVLRANLRTLTAQMASELNIAIWAMLT